MIKYLGAFTALQCFPARETPTYLIGFSSVSYIFMRRCIELMSVRRQTTAKLIKQRNVKEQKRGTKCGNETLRGLFFFLG